MKYLVTGCAGFIGSNLTDRLLSEGFSVIGIDNFSTGQRKFLNKALQNKNFQFHQIDITDYEDLLSVITKDIDTIFHMAANADVRFGLYHTKKEVWWHSPFIFCGSRKT